MSLVLQREDYFRSISMSVFLVSANFEETSVLEAQETPEAQGVQSSKKMAPMEQAFQHLSTSSQCRCEDLFGTSSFTKLGPIHFLIHFLGGLFPDTNLLCSTAQPCSCCGASLPYFQHRFLLLPIQPSAHPLSPPFSHQDPRSVRRTSGSCFRLTAGSRQP
jgi:hypothetical protein